MAHVSLEDLKTVLDRDFGGTLCAGAAAKGSGQCCGLQLLSAVKKIGWTDDPEWLDTWDLRPLNDVAVTSSLRTEHFLPVLAAYSDSVHWSWTKQLAVIMELLPAVISLFAGRGHDALLADANERDLSPEDCSTALLDVATLVFAKMDAGPEKDQLFVRACQAWLEAAAQGDEPDGGQSCHDVPSNS